MYTPLNLPAAQLKIKGSQVWDNLRKKFVELTPEEWVRQHFIHYLSGSLKYPEGLMASEYTVDYNGMKKRCDIVCFSRNLTPFLVVECKAPDISLSEETFYQLARYAATLRPSLLILTNGLTHYCAQIDNEKGSLVYLEQVPAYQVKD